MKFEGVREARIEAGRTVAEVAQAAGKSLGWVYAIERSLTVPSEEDAGAIGDLLEKDPDELFSRIRTGEVAA